MQMDNQAMAIGAGVVQQDVLMVDSDNKTFLYLRLQGLAVKKLEK